MKINFFCCLVTGLFLASCANETCPHDGNHGDAVTVTVAHNGKVAKCVAASADLIEDDPELVAEAARCAFNKTLEQPQSHWTKLYPENSDDREREHEFMEMQIKHLRH